MATLIKLTMAVIMFWLFSLGLSAFSNGKSVLVIGGSGRVGRAVVRKLINAGVSTKVMVRSIASATSEGAFPLPKEAALIEGSVDKLADIIRASKDVDTIIDVHGPSPPRFTKLSDIYTDPGFDSRHPYCVNYLGTQRVLEAMKANNIRKLVRLTGALVGKSAFSPFVVLFNALLSMTVKWHEASELAIRASGVDYTCIRPPEIREELPAAINHKTLVLIPERYATEEAAKTAPLNFGPSSISIEDLADLVVIAGTQPNSAKTSSVLSRASVVPLSRSHLFGKRILPPNILPDVLNLNLPILGKLKKRTSVASLTSWFDLIPTVASDYTEGEKVLKEKKHVAGVFAYAVVAVAIFIHSWGAALLETLSVVWGNLFYRPQGRGGRYRGREARMFWF